MSDLQTRGLSSGPGTGMVQQGGGLVVARSCSIQNVDWTGMGKTARTHTHTHTHTHAHTHTHTNTHTHTHTHTHTIVFVAPRLVATNICRNKRVFVPTNVLARQAYFCRDKRRALLRQKYFCRDKNILLRQNTSFVATTILLSRQK